MGALREGMPGAGAKRILGFHSWGRAPLPVCTAGLPCTLHLPQHVNKAPANFALPFLALDFMAVCVTEIKRFTFL